MSATSTRSVQSMAGLEEDRFEAARAVADAVLYEGYVLYPYRASSRKNQVRFQWACSYLVPTARPTVPNVGRPGPNVSPTWATARQARPSDPPGTRPVPADTAPQS